MKEYILRTVIDGNHIEVVCDIGTAKVLLPLWAKAEPNMTSCREIRTGTCIVCFGDDEKEIPPEVPPLPVGKEYFVIGVGTPQYEGQKEEQFRVFGIGGHCGTGFTRKNFLKLLAEKRKLAPHLGRTDGYLKLQNAKQLANRKNGNLRPLNIVCVEDGKIVSQIVYNGGIIELSGGIVE